MKFVCIFFVKIYQKTFAKIIYHKCCFTPTCSAYSIESFARFGTIIGFKLTIERIFKCRKKNMGKYNPVPQNIKGDYKWLI